MNFFKKFFLNFGEDFTEILNDDSDIMPDTFKVAILKFIPKNDKKVKSKNDLRPISLTNYEYRIWTKVLFLRCKRVSEFYFSDVQTCSIPGRRIHDNLIAIRDILQNFGGFFFSLQT